MYYTRNKTKAVRQLDINTGDLIALHKSIRSAAKEMTGFTDRLELQSAVSNISKATRNNPKHKSAYGYKWELVEGENNG